MHLPESSLGSRFKAAHIAGAEQEINSLRNPEGEIGGGRRDRDEFAVFPYGADDLLAGFLDLIETAFQDFG